MWCMGRGRGGSSMEGEEDIISRENEVEEHEIGAKGETTFTMLWLDLHRFPTLTVTTTAPIPLRLPRNNPQRERS